jgi:hypothetical protein
LTLGRYIDYGRLSAKSCNALPEAIPDGRALIGLQIDDHI